MLFSDTRRLVKFYNWILGVFLTDMRILVIDLELFIHSVRSVLPSCVAVCSNLLHNHAHFEEATRTVQELP